MTIDAKNDLSQGVPALAAAPIGEAVSSARLEGTRPPVPGSDQSSVRAATTASKEPRPIRIGDKVCSFVNDVFVSIGLGGLVVNVAPPRHDKPARARVLWDNETESMADANTFVNLTLTRELITKAEGTAVAEEPNGTPQHVGIMVGMRIASTEHHMTGIVIESRNNRHFRTIFTELSDAEDYRILWSDHSITEVSASSVSREPSPTT